jgi:hypothetical protein
MKVNEKINIQNSNNITINSCINQKLAKKIKNSGIVN